MLQFLTCLRDNPIGPMLSYVPTVGENIKRLRLKAGIRTQSELAKVLGVPQPQASDWENDRYKALDTRTLLKIAKGLNVSIDDLVLGIDEHYDAIAGRTRAESTHAEKTVVVTTPDTTPGVSSSLSTAEEAIHAGPGASSRNRPSESGEAVFKQGKIVTELLEISDRVRVVASACSAWLNAGATHDAHARASSSRGRNSPTSRAPHGRRRSAR